MVVWPGCLQVASSNPNFLVCVNNTTVNTSVCFRLDGCVLHNHPALSHDVIIIVCNVIGDTGPQIGVITESESADDTGPQVGVVGMMRFSDPDSLGKNRDEGSHINYLNQPTRPQAGFITEFTVDAWYVGDTGPIAGFTIMTKVYTKSSDPDSLSIFRDDGNQLIFNGF